MGHCPDDDYNIYVIYCIEKYAAKLKKSSHFQEKKDRLLEKKS